MPHSNELSSEREDAFNDTFDLDDSLYPRMSPSKCNEIRSAVGSRRSSRGNILHPAHSSHLVVSQPSSVQEYSQMNMVRSRVPFLNNDPVCPKRPVMLRTGRSRQHYMEAQAFSMGLAKTQLSSKITKNAPFLLSKPAPLMPDMATHNSRISSNSNENDFDRVNRIGNREQILKSNCKFGKPSRRMASQSGIPVRAV